MVWSAHRSRVMIQVCWTQLALEDICIYLAIALECVSGDSKKAAIDVRHAIIPRSQSREARLRVC